MAQSHGMSPQDHTKALFDQELDDLYPDERPNFLFNTIDDFVQRVEYKRGAPIGETDIWIAVHAAQILLADLNNGQIEITPSQAYLLDKFIQVVEEVSEKLGKKADTSKIREALDKLKSPEQSPILIPRHILGTESANRPPGNDPSNSRKPKSDVEKSNETIRGSLIESRSSRINLDDFRIRLRIRNGRPKNLSLDVFPPSPSDDFYATKLKAVASSFLGKSDMHGSKRMLKRLVATMDPLGLSQSDVYEDLEDVIRSGIDQMARMISEPKRFSKEAVSVETARGLGISRIVVAIRKVEESGLDVQAVLSNGDDAYDYFNTAAFNQIAINHLNTLLRSSNDEHLDKAWDIRKIARAVGNTELETLAALAYAYFHETNETKIILKPKMVAGLTREAISGISTEMLDRVAMNGKTWKSMAEAVVPGLNGIRINQGMGR